MIAHSLNHPSFGIAQKLHGATFIVDVTFTSRELNEQNVVIDIAKASEMIKHVLDDLRYQNLDNLPALKGTLTSAEFMAKYIHDLIKENISGYFAGKITVTLGESHLAWVTFSPDDSV
jgi:6-pyruvoyltetrahydropterin/6-carboxytetrahydropterin synthase